MPFASCGGQTTISTRIQKIAKCWFIYLVPLLLQVALILANSARRGILSIVSSIYDPLGFVAPFILPAKRLLQNLCRRGLGWDDMVSNEDITIWQGWLGDLLSWSPSKFIDVSSRLTSVTSQLVRSTTLLMPVRFLMAQCPIFASQMHKVSFIVHSSLGNPSCHHSSILLFLD